ncbi:immunoglobulin-like domain-containing receptor 2 isoform X2 [Denticeps clupeoides]|uniref:immunoglobulin-like domain-containing receptor 2 isoform X2 n=1 Tax=Denticeps clupeoides TaxID=299321 RepID=UPI0010A4CB65|nr:immunoglobulin-like domain-containing receptor 2 isoform X2 [Denticeps clupeoides]
MVCSTRLWLPVLLFAAVSEGEAVQVTMRDERMFAMLFQSVVLPCQYTSISTQTPIVQWWYKSYCRDRTRESFNFPETLGVRGSELGSASHLDCGDNGRTVRIVASGQGSSITLAEHYKGRDISIINKADLRIGELHWGDSGVYYCKVVITDDLEGDNEGQVELLVLGMTGVAEEHDLLPEVELEFMPEWVFVGVVALGSILFILLVGVCWCQCCPHSCCCYVRCCCCPDSCCCPRHLYEAGKALKSPMSLTPVPMYPPYYVTGVPTMVPIAPPSLVDPKLSAAPSVENHANGVRGVYHMQPNHEQDSLKMLQYVERELAQFNPSKTLSSLNSCSLSELSSLHEAETDFRQTYRQVQKKALPAIPDLDVPPDHRRDAPSAQTGRSIRYPQHCMRMEDEALSRCAHSEHLHRKPYNFGDRRGSLDELEEFAMSYVHHGRRGNLRDVERAHEHEREHERFPTYRDGAHCYHSIEHPPAAENWKERQKQHGRPPPPPRSPPSSPAKRRGTWDSDRPVPRRDAGGRGRGGRDYDDTLLTSLLERKARMGRGSARGGRGEGESDTPSKDSSKKSNERHSSRSPSNQSPSNPSPSTRPREDDSLPPYAEKELDRQHSREASPRPFTQPRPAQGPCAARQEHRDDHSKPRKVSTLLSRDSLIV